LLDLVFVLISSESIIKAACYQEVRARLNYFVSSISDADSD